MTTYQVTDGNGDTEIEAISQIDAQIIKVRNDGAGKNYVVFANGTEREVASWQEACAALKRGEIERNLLGIKI